MLVLFHSGNGATYQLARALARAAGQEAGVTVDLRQVPPINPSERDLSQPFAAVPFARPETLGQYDGIALGSPVYFGGASAAMRLFLEGTLQLWAERQLEGMPATVFSAAGKGAARDAALQSLWASLAIHGMLLIPAGMRGLEDSSTPQLPGNSVFGAASLSAYTGSAEPDDAALALAAWQGRKLAQTAKALKPLRLQQQQQEHQFVPDAPAALSRAETRLLAQGISLPELPAPIGNYLPYKQSGKLVFINQIALKDGAVLHPGSLDHDISQEQAAAAARQAMLNVLAVLKQATGNNLDRVRQVVQLTAYLNTASGFGGHAGLLKDASDLLIHAFGDAGTHTRAAIGAVSLPLHTAVELQVIFELW